MSHHFDSAAARADGRINLCDLYAFPAGVDATALTGHAARVTAAFLPDVLTCRPGQPAAFHPGDGNGRALGDNAFDIAVAVLTGSTLGTAATPRQATPAFPYLSAPQPADLPPLADYFRSPQASTR